MQTPGIGRIGYIANGSRIGRIVDVNNAKPLRADMTDVGVASMHHDLLTVRAPSLVAVADDAHVVCVRWLGNIRPLGHAQFLRLWFLLAERYLLYSSV